MGRTEAKRGILPEIAKVENVLYNQNKGILEVRKCSLAALRTLGYNDVALFI